MANVEDTEANEELEIMKPFGGGKFKDAKEACGFFMPYFIAEWRSGRQKLLILPPVFTSLHPLNPELVARYLEDQTEDSAQQRKCKANKRLELGSKIIGPDNERVIFETLETFGEQSDQLFFVLHGLKIKKTDELIKKYQLSAELLQRIKKGEWEVADFIVFIPKSSMIMVVQVKSSAEDASKAKLQANDSALLIDNIIHALKVDLTTRAICIIKVLAFPSVFRHDLLKLTTKFENYLLLCREDVEDFASWMKTVLCSNTGNISFKTEVEEIAQELAISSSDAVLKSVVSQLICLPLPASSSPGTNKEQSAIHGETLDQRSSSKSDSPKQSLGTKFSSYASLKHASVTESVEKIKRHDFGTGNLSAFGMERMKKDQFPGLRLLKIICLTQEQAQIYFEKKHSSPSQVIYGPAGTGKTVLLTGKALEVALKIRSTDVGSGKDIEATKVIYIGAVAYCKEFKQRLAEMGQENNILVYHHNEFLNTYGVGKFFQAAITQTVIELTKILKNAYTTEKVAQFEEYVRRVVGSEVDQGKLHEFAGAIDEGVWDDVIAVLVQMQPIYETAAEEFVKKNFGDNDLHIFYDDAHTSVGSVSLRPGPNVSAQDVLMDATVRPLFITSLNHAIWCVLAKRAKIGKSHFWLAIDTTQGIPVAIWDLAQRLAKFVDRIPGTVKRKLDVVMRSTPAILSFWKEFYMLSRNTATAVDPTSSVLDLVNPIIAHRILKGEVKAEHIVCLEEIRYVEDRTKVGMDRVADTASMLGRRVAELAEELISLGERPVILTNPNQYSNTIEAAVREKGISISLEPYAQSVGADSEKGEVTLIEIGGDKLVSREWSTVIFIDVTPIIKKSLKNKERWNPEATVWNFDEMNNLRLFTGMQYLSCSRALAKLYVLQLVATN